MHPDEAAFLAALADNPGDDTARVVFADWLDDHDDPRGPWVRDRSLWHYMKPDATDPVPRLIDALRRGEWVHPLLAQVGPAAARAVAAALTAAPVGENPQFRAGLAETLGLIGRAESAVPALVAALGDPDVTVQRQAAVALGRIGPAAVEAVPPLAAALRSEGYRVQTDAAEALYRIGPGAAPAAAELARALPTWWAMRALERIGPGAADAIPELLRALADTSPHTRYTAVRVCAAIGPAAEPAVPGLIRALVDDMHHGTPAEAIRALGAVGPASAPAVPALIGYLAHDSRGRAVERLSAAEALGRIGPAAAAAVPALTLLLRDWDSRLRYRAARALGEIGPAAVAAVPALIGAPDVPADRGRKYARPRRSRRSPGHGLYDLNPGVRARAAEALGRIGAGAEGATGRLGELLGAPEYDLRTAARVALDRLRGFA